MGALRRLILAALASLALIAGALPAHAAGSDTTAPVVGAAFLSRAGVDLTTGPPTITAFITLRDDSSGVNEIRLRLASDHFESGVRWATASLVSGTDRDGTFNATFTLPSSIASDTWTLYVDSLSDKARNFVVAPAIPGTRPTVEVVSPTITAPSQPTEVTATAGDSSALVSWAAPGRDGGSPITGYNITANGTRVATAGPGATSVTLSGLVNRFSYVFTVWAQNSIGGSPDSAPSLRVFPFAPPTPAPATPTVVVSTAVAPPLPPAAITCAAARAELDFAARQSGAARAKVDRTRKKLKKAKKARSGPARAAAVTKAKAKVAKAKQHASVADSRLAALRAALPPQC